MSSSKSPFKNSLRVKKRKSIAEIHFQEFNMQFIEHEILTSDHRKASEANQMNQIDVSKFRKLKTPQLMESIQNSSFGQYVINQPRESNMSKKSVNKNKVFQVHYPKTGFPMINHDEAYNIKTKNLAQKRKELQALSQNHNNSNRNRSDFGHERLNSNYGTRQHAKTSFNSPQRRLVSQSEANRERLNYHHLDHNMSAIDMNQTYIDNGRQSALGSSIIQEFEFRPQSVNPYAAIADQNNVQKQSLKDAKVIFKFQDKGILNSSNLKMNNITKRISNYHILKDHRKFTQQRASSQEKIMSRSWVVTSKRMNLGFQTAQEMTLILMQVENIRYLDLQKNALGDQSITILMHSIKRSKSLYYLNLASTAITQKGAKRIFRALRKNESLVQLSLGCVDGVYRNRIGMKGLHEFRNMLQNNKTLSILDISYNRIMNEGFKALIFAIENQESIISINVSNNEITKESLLEVKNSLVNTSLQSLEINNNAISNEGLDVLLANLKAKYKSKLIRLDLSMCSLNHKIFAKIFPIISKNQFLRFLILDKNNFAKDAFSNIKEGLRNNVTLKCLNDDGAKTIGECITTAGHLQILILSNNSITDRGMEYISTGITKAPLNRFALQTLDLSFNLISDLICYNKTIRTINFKSNLLRDNCGKAILEGLNTHNKYMSKIELTLNQISFAILEQIKIRLRQNEQKDAVHKTKHYFNERLKVLSKQERTQNLQAQEQYEKACQELVKINLIADDKQEKMNKMIDSVKNQIKKQEIDLDLYLQKSQQIDKYFKKLDFEAIVKQKLKESEFSQLEKSLKQLSQHNETIELNCQKLKQKIHRKLDFYIQEVMDIQLHIEEEKQKASPIKESARAGGEDSNNNQSPSQSFNKSFSKSPAQLIKKALQQQVLGSPLKIKRLDSQQF
ncbi:leucine rich repeat family protein [Stylonychia lemnae]|uniref:Leucine rich repeat family protein n=1 Tax=Stylonychia lemnae TaxID=5949 RepID=A0A078B543_STYLE|nr:leucine rich repeat family protein [Stylonychia lemnae]|eukprot:CDW88658.1 leucine rich repeat family protein [Stylonychia lemnae]